MKKIILTSGGTAGHVYPLIEVGKLLAKNHRLKLVYVGLKSGPEYKLAKNLSIPFFGISAGKRRAYFSFLNFFDIFKTFFGIIKSWYLFVTFKPDLVFAKGGYVSYPVIFCAKLFKTRLIIHESDAVIGRANLYAAPAAQKICLGFPIKYIFKYNDLAKAKISIDKLVYTGTPVRSEFTTSEEPAHDSQILFMGGSQGSAQINRLVWEILPQMKNYQVYHLVGEGEIEKFKEKFKDSSNYHPIGYTEEIAQIMKSSQLIISRAGANTLTEISALGKPSILIPLGSSAQDHQKINAQIYNDANAAVVIREKKLTGSALLSIINRLMEDENLRKLLGHHAREFFISNSQKHIVDLIFEENNE